MRNRLGRLAILLAFVFALAICEGGGVDALGEAKDASAPAAMDYSVGSIVSFGAYEQDGDPDDGPEPIAWEVLAVDGSRALMITREVLDVGAYDGGLVAGDITWENSALRAFLNGEFLAVAFTDAERAAICLSALANEAGPDTEDRLFALSLEEYESNKLYVPSGDDEKGLYTPYAMARAGNGPRALYRWWLRGPIAEGGRAMIVNRDGVYTFTESMNGRYPYCGIRPALWLEMDPERQAPFDAPLPEDRCVALPDAEAGDLVRLGSFEQDNIDYNGPEPLEWVVLERQEGRALLLSRGLLRAMPYQQDSATTLWETSDARGWLNGAFLETAFTADEQALIQAVELDNSFAQHPNEARYVDAGPTEDRVFLLSFAEYERYGVDALSMYPTARAKATSDLLGEDRWTRSSMGDTQAFLWPETSVQGSAYFASSDEYVQPAIWVATAE